MKWRERSACLGRDTELFFTSGPASHVALAICKPCTVKNECLALALKGELRRHHSRTRYGIFGGMRGEARSKLKARTVERMIRIYGGDEAVHEVRKTGPRLLRPNPALKTGPRLVRPDPVLKKKLAAARMKLRTRG